MSRFLPSVARSLESFLNLITDLAADALCFLHLMLRSRTALRAEVLFLRKQLAFYEERQLLPRLLRDALVIAHPTAAWTLQQFREAIPSDHPYCWVIRDRDSIFSGEVDDES